MLAITMKQKITSKLEIYVPTTVKQVGADLNVSALS